jgi:large subunit ribosomal protein L9
MKVILTNDVEKLGQSGDIKDVKRGYARNFLFARGLATLATTAALKSYEKSKERREAARQKELESKKASATKMADVKLSFSRQVGDGGKLFGSVGKSDIVKSLKASGHDVDKSQVVLDAALKEIGDFDVEVRFAPEVQTKVKVTIAARS